MKNNNGLVILIVVLVIAVLCLGGYIIYDEVLKEDEVKVECVDNNDDQVTGMSQEEIDNLGEMLFNKTLVHGGNDDYMLYGNNVTYESLSNGEKLKVASLLIPNYFFTLSEYERTGNYPDYCYDSVECLSKSLSAYVLENYYKDIFGQNSSMEKGDFDSCKFQNDEINCYADFITGDIDKTNYFRYDSSEMNDRELLVYSYYLGICGDDVYNVYRGDIYTNVEEYEQLNEDELYKKFGDKASKYKLTFNQDNNGNWYWVSTELVK